MEKFLVLLIAAPLFEDKIPDFQQAQVLSRATWSSWASKKRLAPALKKKSRHVDGVPYVHGQQKRKQNP